MPPIKDGLFLGGTKVLKHDDRADSAVDDYKTEGRDDSDADEFDAENQQAALQVRPRPHAKPGHVKRDHTKADPRIKELKQQGYNDTYVSRQLKKEGFINYAEKTIAGRWRKIRTALEKAEEEDLDDNLSDWHEGDDDMLQDAFNNAEEKFMKEVQKLEQTKWKNISMNLGIAMNKKKYTSKACKERFDAVQAGTNEPVFERDPDPQARIERRDKRIRENKRRRAAAKKAIRDAEAAKQRALDEEKQRKIEAKLLLVTEKQQKMAEEQEAKRLREERRDGMEAERRKRRAAIERIRANAAEQRRIKTLECAVFRYYTGREVARVHGLKIHTNNKAEEEEDIDTDDLLDSEEDDASSADDGLTTTLTQKEKIAKRRADSVMDSGPAEVTKATLHNPRSIMTTVELDMLIHARGLPRRLLDEQHPEVVARLDAADKDTATNVLEDLLARHFKSQKGTRPKRVARLQEADAADSKAGKEGVKVTDPEFRERYEGYHGKYAYLLDE